MPISESLPIVNLTPVILKTFRSIYSRWEWKGNFWQVWKFSWDLRNVISRGNWLFMWNYVFQVGLCTPLQTMCLVGIELGTLQFLQQHLNPLDHSFPHIVWIVLSQLKWQLWLVQSQQSDISDNYYLPKVSKITAITYQKLVKIKWRSWLLLLPLVNK